MNRRELESQLQDLFDGSLLQGESSDLQQKLRTDPEARERYMDYLFLDHAMRFRSKGADTLGMAPRRAKPPGTSRSPAKWMMAAAAVVVFAGGIAIWKSQRSSFLQFSTSPGTNVSLSDEFTSKEQSFSGSTMKPGSRLEIGEGTIEVHLDSGVRGIVRGPASIVLFRRDVLELKKGTAWFDLENTKIDFKVRTPDLIIAGKGGEFGLVCDSSFPSEIHVLKGTVQATNRHGRKEEKSLAAGQARVAGDDGEWQDIPVRQNRFLTSLPAVERGTNLVIHKEFNPNPSAYAEEVRGDDLLAGIIPEVSGWKTENQASPSELTDGIHGSRFMQNPRDWVYGAWTTVGATAEYTLGKGANGTGYDINVVRSIADWENVGFGNQAWTLEIKPVGGDWISVASVAYEPLKPELTKCGATKVTLEGKDGTVARGVEALKITAGRITGSVEHVFVWRELDVFGKSSDPKRSPVIPLK
ncbi:MAG: hypothetical protein V4689_08945 [Verrucomicrobiota bacterium]